jgi:hypothetical protein
VADIKPGWLRDGLREVAETATDEDRRRVAEHPSGFLPQVTSLPKRGDRVRVTHVSGGRRGWRLDRL